MGARTLTLVIHLQNLPLLLQAETTYVRKLCAASLYSLRSPAAESTTFQPFRGTGQVKNRPYVHLVAMRLMMYYIPWHLSETLMMPTRMIQVVNSWIQEMLVATESRQRRHQNRTRHMYVLEQANTLISNKHRDYLDSHSTLSAT